MSQPSSNGGVRADAATTASQPAAAGAAATDAVAASDRRLHISLGAAVKQAIEPAQDKQTLDAAADAKRMRVVMAGAFVLRAASACCAAGAFAALAARHRRAR